MYVPVVVLFYNKINKYNYNNIIDYRIEESLFFLFIILYRDTKVKDLR